MAVVINGRGRVGVRVNITSPIPNNDVSFEDGVLLSFEDGTQVTFE